MAEQKIVDGYNVGRLNDTIDMIKEEPELAKFKFRAHNEWISGQYCKTTVRDFYGAGEEHSHSRTFELVADEPDELLGTDKGPNASEAVLYALSSCLIGSLVVYAAEKGIEITELTLDLEGEVDLRGLLDISKEVRNGYQNITATFTVTADATEEEIRELCEAAQAHSPVFDTITKPVPVNVKVNAMSSTAAAGV